MKTLISCSPLNAAAAALACAFSAIQPAVADDLADLKKEIVETYAAIAGFSTADAQAQATALRSAVAEFTAAPDAASLEKAQQAWVAARLPYLQSEVFRPRAAGGPVDAGFDAASVDYLDDLPQSGIIADAERYPSIDKIFIASLGTKSGGFAAIEFLLWGEDRDIEGPGTRPLADFVGSDNPAAVRRAQYLKACSELVAEDAAALATAWKVGHAGNQRSQLLAMPADQALAGILGDLATFAGDELAVKRIGSAYEARHGETSGFSDQTHLDMIYNCSGMANLVAGAYVGLDREVKVQGAGLLKLAEALGKQHAVDLKFTVNGMMLAVTEFRPPFDRALLAPDDSPAREAIREIIRALKEFSQVTAALSKALAG